MEMFKTLYKTAQAIIIPSAVLTLLNCSEDWQAENKFIIECQSGIFQVRRDNLNVSAQLSVIHK